MRISYWSSDVCSSDLVVEQLLVGLGALVVAGGDRGATDLELPDLALLERVPGGGVDDADLQALDRPAEDGQVAHALGVAGDRRGVALVLEDSAVDRVGSPAGPERKRDVEGQRVP